MQRNVFDDKIIKMIKMKQKYYITKTEGIDEIRKKLGRGRRQGKL